MEIIFLLKTASMSRTYLRNESLVGISQRPANTADWTTCNQLCTGGVNRRFFKSMLCSYHSGHISFVKLTTFRHLRQYVTLLSDSQRCSGSPQPEQPHSSWRSMLSATAIYPSETGDHMVPLYPVYTLHKRDAAAAPRHHNDAGDGGEVERGGKQAASPPHACQRMLPTIPIRRQPALP